MGEFHPDFDGVWVCMGVFPCIHIDHDTHCIIGYCCVDQFIPSEDPSFLSQTLQHPFPGIYLVIMVALSEGRCSGPEEGLITLKLCIFDPPPTSFKTKNKHPSIFNSTRKKVTLPKEVGHPV